MRRRTRGAATVAAATLLITLTIPANAVLAHPAPDARVLPDVQNSPIRDGETQPIYSRADAILETVFVETEADSDGDGVPDRVAVDIMRPRETERGLKVPTIMEASPYYAGLNDIPNHDVDIDERMLSGAARLQALRAAGALPAGPFDSYYDNFFVPRGYAVALVESLGSGRATGCPTSGARNETLGIKAAVDWLNGRAKGYGPDGAPERAEWSTGNVGMIGVSYNGTLPNAVATTGVRGLKTIVPIAAISSWYDYYRAGGGVVAPGGFQGEDTDVLAKLVLTRQDPEACAGVIAGIERDQDRVTGDYSPFWHERNYLPDVRGVRASVLMVHGLNDWNVKTKHFGQWWAALERQRVPRQLWLHQAAHTSPFALRHREWMVKLHHWMDHWLYGIDNNVMREARVEVEHAPGQWRGHADWPEPGTANRSLYLNAAPTAPGQPGELSARPGRVGTQSLDDQGRTRTAEQLADGVAAADPNRLAYLSPPLEGELRMNGAPRMSVRASLDGRSPYLTALLVDYGTDTRATGSTALTGERVCYGQSVPGDEGCVDLRTHRTVTAPFKIVTRGWLDARNRHDPARTEPITPGKTYAFDWEMQPNDYVFKPGHRIGVVLLSTDFDYTLRYPAGTDMTIRTGVSKISLPVAPPAR